MNRMLFILLCFLGSLQSLYGASTSLRIMMFNDVNEPSPVNGWGGLAEMSTLLTMKRQWTAHHLTTVNGDFIGGSFSGNIFQGKEMVDIFNALPVDMVVFGNHEFDRGPEVTAKRIADSTFSWLGTNVVDDKRVPFGGSKATVIYDFDGIKFGFFGLCLPETKQLSNPGQEVVFLPVIETAKGAVKSLKGQGADVIIALTHQTLAEDIRLVSQVPGIRLVLGGHDHFLVNREAEGVLILKAGSNARYLTIADLSVSKEPSASGESKIHFLAKIESFPNVGISPDPKILKIIDAYHAQLQEKFKEKIATLAVPLDSRAAIIRSKESAIGNFFTDAMRAFFRADAALLNAGTIRGDRTYAAGAAWTLGDLSKELPFPDKVYLIELSGKGLQAALEEGLSQQGAGGFPQISGITLAWSHNQPKGQKILTIKVAGNPIEPSKMYKVVVTSFLWNGGDNYAALAKGKKLSSEDEEAGLIEVVLKKIQGDQGMINAAIESRNKED